MVLTGALLTALNVEFISSCRPLCAEEDLKFITGLLGYWSDEESQLSFYGEVEVAYIFITLKTNEISVYKTHFQKIDNNTFLNIYPLDTLPPNYLFQVAHFPLSPIFKIEIEKEQLTRGSYKKQQRKNIIRKISG